MVTCLDCKEFREEKLLWQEKKRSIFGDFFSLGNGVRIRIIISLN